LHTDELLFSVLYVAISVVVTVNNAVKKSGKQYDVFPKELVAHTFPS
jgi:hypothetical protein